MIEVLNVDVLNRADGNVIPDAQPDDPNTQPGNAEVPLRSTLLVRRMVVNVRAAIRNAGHTPLSILADSVPPEAAEHVLNMAAWRLVNSTPNLQMVVITEKGVYAPLADLNKSGEKWLANIPKQGVTPPIDPCGEDWTTAVTWPSDVADWTNQELLAMEWTWAEMQQLGYTWDEWAAMTNPPIAGTVHYGSVCPPYDLNSATYGQWPDRSGALLGTP